ncbi:extracellular solute-binding protein [Streptomyces sp. NBC_01465]|uniref:extracellular solute-binding protein n=1 Tax=Streptomyces sp. NBC_01465 TaxID=2903878 RepID=UPI002E370FCB|nr:extracellular solute-binding protein [Streptomyces sp. NBC_01465]
MKNRYIAGCIALVSSAALAGCGYLPGNSSGTKTVTVWLMKDSATNDFVQRFKKSYEAEHGDIKLDIRIQEWAGIGDKVTAALKSKDGKGVPDVIEVGNTQVAQYADSKGLRDLTLESMRDLHSQDWLPGLADPGSIDGAQYGVPWYAANRVVIYDKQLFADAGIKHPPRTREEWLEDTARLNTGQQQGIYLAGQDWYTLSGFIWEEGGQLAEGSGGNWVGALNSKAALKGMEFYKQLQALGRGPKSADEAHPFQYKVFAKGDVAQLIATPGTAKSIEQLNPEMKGRLGYFPIPGKHAGKPGAVFIGGSDLVVPEKAPEGDAGVKVVEALAGEKWQTDLAQTMSYVPNKTTLARVLADDPGAAAMAAAAAHGRATPNSPHWAAVEAANPIKTYMTEVLIGGDPEKAAKKASARITDLLADY